MTGDKYTGYTKEATAEAVAMLFESKHGYRPVEVLDGRTVWLAGPLNGGGKKSKGSLVKRAGAAHREMTPERARQLVMELEAEVEVSDEC